MFLCFFVFFPFAPRELDWVNDEGVSQRECDCECDGMDMKVKERKRHEVWLGLAGCGSFAFCCAVFIYGGSRRDGGSRECDVMVMVNKDVEKIYHINVVSFRV
jgi:hypothetical protein